METRSGIASTLPSRPPQPRHVRNIGRDLFLTLFTFGFFNLVVQYRQIRAVNEIIKEKKYSFGRWFFLTIVTLGLYHIYHEYRKSSDLLRIMKDLNPNEPLLTVVLTLFGLWFVADAIQQSHINRFFGSTTL